MTRLRPPGAAQRRGLRAMQSEMEAIADDLRLYKDSHERKRARDILAGLAYLDQLLRIIDEGKGGK